MKKHIKFCSIIYLLCYSFAVYANPYATVTSVDGNVVLHSNNNQPIKILQELNRGDSIEVINGSLKIVFDNDNKEYILKEKGIYLIDENKSISKSGKLIIGREINKKTENIALNEIKQTEQGALQLRSSNSKKDFSILEIEAIKKSNKGILSFDTITTISKDDGIAFKVLVRKDATLSISYLHNGKKSNLLKTKSFKKGDSFIVPKEDKFIYLKKPGKHNFIFEYENNQERIFSILINENKKILKKLASVGFKKKQGVTNSINNTYKLDGLKNFGPTFATPIKDLKTRGSANNLFKSVSRSVVLVGTDDGVGTGSVISNEGEILTNWHVVKGYSSVVIIFKPPNFSDISSSEKYIADVIKVDEEKDLALLRLRTTPYNLKPILLGGIADIEVAMDVHAVGHPKGNFWTYTKGVVSQLTSKFQWTIGDNIQHIADVILTQTPINPGNSGGPLVTDKQKLIGINSFVDLEAQGLNYAVAITSIEEFLRQVPQYKEGEKIEPNFSDVDGDPVDLDEDGHNESLARDTDGNGIYDTLDSDTDGDGIIDIRYFDENENGIPDMYIKMVNYQGRDLIVVSYDEDEDGIIEVVGYDFDMDGEIDKYDRA